MQTKKTTEKRHIISALVENKPGVLARIASLFCARGFNIDSLNVGETDNPLWSRMTITVCGDEQILEQVRKQLEKLIDTLKVTELSEEDVIERDLALIKIKVLAPRRGEIVDIVGIFRARICDVTEKYMVIEVAGSEDKIEAFVRNITPYGIVEMVRAGRIAIKRGD